MWDALNKFDRNRFSGSNLLSFDPPLSDVAIDWWRDNIYAQHGLYPDDLGELLSASAISDKAITIADLDPIGPTLPPALQALQRRAKYVP